MKLLSKGNIAAIIPTPEDFVFWKESAQTDAETRQELIERYAKIGDVALIEVTAQEFVQAANTMFGVDAKQVTSTMRSTLAAWLASQMNKTNS